MKKKKINKLDNATVYMYECSYTQQNMNSLEKCSSLEVCM